MSLTALLQKLTSPKFTLTEEHKRALEILENTNDHLFITGKAGTGKSTLISFFRNNTKKKVVVLAPTGIAALNIKGQTIHSFFKFPPRLIDQHAINKRINNRLYADVDTIILDEISMVRADILDGIDSFLRFHGKDRNLPFGGVQMVFVGDLFQLPPVVTYQEYEVFNRIYQGPYFFNAKVMQDIDMYLIELSTIFRQKEEEYIEVLNKIRTGEVNIQTLQIINNRQVENAHNLDHIILTTTNKVAESINQTKLNAIDKPLFIFNAEIEGVFPTEERNLPVDLELKLKVGAKVMFVKNDVGGMWVNGTTGKVFKLEKDLIQIQLENGSIVDVPQESWENIRYEYDEKTGQIITEVLGKLKQFPIRLAWAVTIHKSQGMTFSKVCVDFSRSPFAHGQTYVALSRCQTLNGLALTRKVYPNDILVDPKIIEFHQRIKK